MYILVVDWLLDRTNKQIWVWGPTSNIGMNSWFWIHQISWCRGWILSYREFNFKDRSHPNEIQFKFGNFISTMPFGLDSWNPVTGSLGSMSRLCGAVLLWLLQTDTRRRDHKQGGKGDYAIKAAKLYRLTWDWNEPVVLMVCVWAKNVCILHRHFVHNINQHKDVGSQQGCY